ncbi:MAG: MFS transporter [Gammaproteobacteria bacterium]|nr:MFS transporter [Gammaproteobacteria bacterium]
MSEFVPVPTRTKVYFGMGAMAEHIALYSFGFFIMLYYNQVLGLPATLAGLGPTLALIVDAITDPLMGSYSDRFRSAKWGRRHPFMLIAPIPVVASFYFVFNPPADLGTTGLFIWLIVFSILVRSAMTLYFVPHLAFGGEMSKDYHERSSIMAFNNIGTYLGSAGSHFFSLKFIFIATAGYSSGLLVPEAYHEFSVIASVIIFFALYACAWFTKDRIPTLSQPNDDVAPFNFKDFFGDIGKVLRNRNYVYLLLGLLFLSITLGMRAAFNNYMNIYFWEFDTSLIANLVFASIIGYALGFMFTPKLHRIFDKRNIIVWSCIAYAFGDAVPVCLRLLGYYPENGDPWVFPGVLFFHVIGSAGLSVINISVMSALADIADENEVRFGQRQEGMLYSARTFFSKADRALGTFIAGVALDVISFPTKAVPGEVDADVIFKLGVIDSPVTIVPALVGACLYAGYRLNKKTHDGIRKKLDERQAEPVG